MASIDGQNRFRGWIRECHIDESEVVMDARHILLATVVQIESFEWQAGGVTCWKTCYRRSKIYEIRGCRLVDYNTN